MRCFSLSLQDAVQFQVPGRGYASYSNIDVMNEAAGSAFSAELRFAQTPAEVFSKKARLLLHWAIISKMSPLKTCCKGTSV
jgi:hypothetical protein